MVRGCPKPDLVGVTPGPAPDIGGTQRAKRKATGILEMWNSKFFSHCVGLMDEQKRY